jgi:hypothetical protein
MTVLKLGVLVVKKIEPPSQNALLWRPSRIVDLEECPLSPLSSKLGALGVLCGSVLDSPLYQHLEMIADSAGNDQVLDG